jgi:hypothetical protein
VKYLLHHRHHALPAVPILQRLQLQMTRPRGSTFFTDYTDYTDCTSLRPRWIEARAVRCRSFRSTVTSLHATIGKRPQGTPSNSGAATLRLLWYRAASFEAPSTAGGASLFAKCNATGFKHVAPTGEKVRSRIGRIFTGEPSGGHHHVAAPPHQPEAIAQRSSRRLKEVASRRPAAGKVQMRLSKCVALVGAMVSLPPVSGSCPGRSAG